MEVPPSPEHPQPFENTYDCWDALPDFQPTVAMRRLYKDDEEFVRNVLKRSEISFAVQSVKTVEYRRHHMRPLTLTEATYTVPLAITGFPRKYTIGETFTMTHLIQSIHSLEEMHISDKAITTEAEFYVGNAYQALTGMIKRSVLHNIFPQSNAWETDEESSAFNDSPMRDRGINRFRAWDILKSRWSATHSENLTLLTQLIARKVASIKSPPLTEKWDKLMRADFSIGNNCEGVLCPTGSIYFDGWQDSHFTADYLPGRVIIGTMPNAHEIKFTTNDAGAEIFLTRLAKRHIQGGMYPVEGVRSPQNMTNLQLIGIPAIPEMISEAEGGLHPRETAHEGGWDGSPSTESGGEPYDGRIRAVICSQPERINPGVLFADLDGKFGRNSWLLFTQAEENTLIPLVPKEKSRWKVTSRKITPTVLPDFETAAIDELERPSELDWTRII